MTGYLTFVAFAFVLAIAPGPDSFLTLRSTVVGGRARGAWTAVGITASNMVQGLLAATGLGALIAASEPVFQAIKWAGVAYLAWLGFSAIRDAFRAHDGWTIGSGKVAATRWTAMRQGFLCNITNPKVLAFNIAVLPQFVDASSGFLTILLYAWTLCVVGDVVLAAIIWLGGYAANALTRVKVRRAVDAGTGAVLLGFAGALAAEA